MSQLLADFAQKSDRKGVAAMFLLSSTLGSFPLLSGCQGLPGEQRKQRWGGGGGGRPTRWPPRTGLGKGTLAFAPRAQPSKPCSGRSQKRLLPLLPCGCPSAWRPAQSSTLDPDPVSFHLDPLSASPHSAMSSPANDTSELPRPWLWAPTTGLYQGQSVVNWDTRLAFPKGCGSL